MSKDIYKRSTVIDRIIAKIERDKVTGCWNFTGSLNNEGGYGVLKRKGKVITVHRYVYWYYNIKPKGTSWEEFVENNKDLDVCHCCDNHRCCNPKHLFLGNRSANMKDSMKKGRIAKGEDHGKHKLTEKQVLKIYRMKGTQQSIADKFGISQRQVSSIKKVESWGWLIEGGKKEEKK